MPVMVVVGTLLGGALSCGAASDRAPRAASAPNEPQKHRGAPVASNEPLLAQTELTAEELAALDPLEDVDTNFQLGALLPLLSGGGELACSSGPPSVTPDPTCAGPEAAVARLASTLATESPVPAWASEMTASCASAWSSQQLAARFRRDFYARDRAARRRFDATLASLESCRGFQPGIVRLLRAHFFPECAPELARETLGDNRVSGSLRVALAGLGLRSRLAEAPLRVPEYGRSMSAEQVERYVTRKLAPWASTEAEKLDAAGQWLTLLPKNSYGRAVAAIALSSRWAKLRDSVAVRNLERPAARERFATLSLPLLEELARAGRAPAADAARSVLVATDWALVVPWTRELKGGLLSSAQEVVLPALKSPFELSDARRIWALVPSYVAARLVAGDKLDVPTLRALATAGLDPTLRRALAGPARLSSAIAEVVAHERLLLALRAFDPAQARAANRLLDVAASMKAPRPLAALDLFVAASPAGLEGWASSSGLSGAEILVRVAGDSTLSPTERALLKWDALMLSGVHGNDLRVGDSPLIDDARRSLHDADIALRECQTGALFPKRCGCPRAAEL
jgi:hypothetical protein